MKQQETIKDVVPVTKVPGLLEVLCESGKKYSTFNLEWKEKIGATLEIDFIEVEKTVNGKVYKNFRINDPRKGGSSTTANIIKLQDRLEDNTRLSEKTLLLAEEILELLKAKQVPF